MRNWQQEITDTRQRVESHWGTPDLVATARFIHEEAAELQSVLNRIENPGLLRSVPLSEKDMPARELGQLLCMTGTLANSLDISLKESKDENDYPRDLSLLVDWLNVKTATLAYSISSRVQAGFTIDKIIAHAKKTGALQEIFEMINVAGEKLGIDPYGSMSDFLREIETKVAKKRLAEQGSPSP